MFVRHLKMTFGVALVGSLLITTVLALGLVYVLAWLTKTERGAGATFPEILEIAKEDYEQLKEAIYGGV